MLVAVNRPAKFGPSFSLRAQALCPRPSHSVNQWQQLSTSPRGMSHLLFRALDPKLRIFSQ